MDYIKDGPEIYRRSFATIRNEADLSRLPGELEPVAVRLIHACGMTDLVADLAYSNRIASTAREALQAGAPIFCDAKMVAEGITRARLPRDNRVICTLNDERVRAMADKLATTRSAAAIDLWEGEIEGSLVAIGNAPTALFHLLERLDQGWPRPAAIIGLPVGFIGAAESKAELARNSRGVEFLTLHGRRGGSAMAVAAVNALADRQE